MFTNWFCSCTLEAHGKSVCMFHSVVQILYLLVYHADSRTLCLGPCHKTCTVRACLLKARPRACLGRRPIAPNGRDCRARDTSDTCFKDSSAMAGSRVLG